MARFADVHTCHAECPCHTGGEPVPDFLPVGGALSRYTYLFTVLDRFERERQRLAGQTCPKCDGSGEGEVAVSHEDVVDGPCDLCDGRGVL